ncbi:hypothetical protein L6452_13783 [Arctium lappa]|uniref:Uncharacterized protein n=1 Tax=Arctium lappa TaxID=4217 RepID=A0ACB9CJ61_ARCLA|nr:hypothetical protein L6452_13783 [Arctium lappa]
MPEAHLIVPAKLVKIAIRMNKMNYLDVVVVVVVAEEEEVVRANASSVVVASINGEGANVASRWEAISNEITNLCSS